MSPTRSLVALSFTLAATLSAAITSGAHAADPKGKAQGNPVVLSQRVIDIAGGINFDSMKKAQKEVLELASPR
jgi:hypothetical protein